MGICTEQAIKIRNLVKTAGNLSGGGGAAASVLPTQGSLPNTRPCEELRAAREHARVVEQHAEILVLSLRYGGPNSWRVFANALAAVSRRR